MRDIFNPQHISKAGSNPADAAHALKEEGMMPIDIKKYSPFWSIIRGKILDRAKNRCELCNAENYKPHWKTQSKVVLTIHHIDYDIKNDKDYNLIALCQRCHNKLDMPLRIRNRKTKTIGQSPVGLKGVR